MNSQATHRGRAAQGFVSRLLALILLAVAFGSSAQAVQNPVSPVVNSTADPGDGTCADAGTGGDCTLREAIAFAASGAAITFASGLTGPITLASQLTIDKNLTITGPAGGLTVRRDAANPSEFRLLAITVDAADAASTVQLTNLTLSGGKASVGDGGIFGSGAGGGIFNFAGTLTLTNVTVSGNTAEAESTGGGGIENRSGTITLIDSTVTGNMAGVNGGGIFNDGALTLTNSTVSGNTAGANGGGIINSSSSTLTLTHSTISGNTAGEGGGIQNSGTATLAHSTVSGNTATSGFGGGIDNVGGLTLANSTVSGNTGSGITGNAAGATLINSTVTNNSGGGIINVNNSSATLTNSLVALNTGVDVQNSGGGLPGTTTASHSLIGSASGNSLQDGVNGNIVGQDPKLGPLANNGGPTKTHALLAGSPAIDTADNDVCAAAPVNNKDQRGLARPKDGDGNGSAICDIGSFEVQASVLICNGKAVTIKGTPGNDNLAGTNGNDVIHGLGGSDNIAAGNGNDTVCGGDGDDNITGGNGRDWLSGEGGLDSLSGGDGDDRLFGGADRDNLSGGNGIDTLDGGADNDRCAGGAGSDTGTACEPFVQ